jgi:hypothetical protein
MTALWAFFTANENTQNVMKLLRFFSSTQVWKDDNFLFTSDRLKNSKADLQIEGWPSLTKLFFL